MSLVALLVGGPQDGNRVGIVEPAVPKLQFNLPRRFNSIITGDSIEISRHEVETYVLDHSCPTTGDRRIYLHESIHPKGLADLLWDGYAGGKIKQGIPS